MSMIDADWLAPQVQNLRQQVDLIIQILEQQEKRGWMSGNAGAPQADKEVKKLMDTLRATKH